MMTQHALVNFGAALSAAGTLAIGPQSVTVPAWSTAAERARHFYEGHLRVGGIGHGILLKRSGRLKVEGARHSLPSLKSAESL